MKVYLFVGPRACMSACARVCVRARVLRNRFFEREQRERARGGKATVNDEIGSKDEGRKRPRTA